MPYISQERRAVIREAIDEQVDVMRKLSEGRPEGLQDEVYKTLLEDDIWYMLQLKTSTLQFSEGRSIDINTPMPRITAELRRRLDSGEKVGGDLNFCICRYLVGLTQIHTAPRYEDKIQWIQERLEAVAKRIPEHSGHPTDQDKKALGILRCVSLELYRRYSAKYEDEACKREDAGDIME